MGYKLPVSALKEFHSTALFAAKEASIILLQHWGKLNDIREKSSAGDLVTEADKKSEEVILGVLKSRYPEHAIISEETGLHSILGAEFMWAVDPLDGTTNYTHQVPMVSISIALLHQGKPVVGLVYNPFINELFEAKVGCGATLNGKKIEVSTVEELGKSLLATGFAYDRRDTPDNNYAEFCYLTSQTQGVRRMGSAAIDLAYVAAGRIDGFWERGLNIWDIAAGALLVAEAGGQVSSYENTPLEVDSGRILASNGRIHGAMSRMLLEAHDHLKPIVF